MVDRLIQDMRRGAWDGGEDERKDQREPREYMAEGLRGFPVEEELGKTDLP